MTNMGSSGSSQKNQKSKDREILQQFAFLRKKLNEALKDHKSSSRTVAKK